MELYSILNDILAIVGLDVALLLSVALLFSGILMAMRQLHRPPGRFIRFCTWSPLVLSITLIGLSVVEYWRLISLLVQQDAISQAQTQLMVRSAVWSGGRCLAVGGLATLWLRLLIRGQPSSIDANACL